MEIEKIVNKKRTDNKEVKKCLEIINKKRTDNKENPYLEEKVDLQSSGFVKDKFLEDFPNTKLNKDYYILVIQGEKHRNLVNLKEKTNFYYSKFNKDVPKNKLTFIKNKANNSGLKEEKVEIDM